MKKLLKIFAVLVVVLVIVLIGGIVYLNSVFPNIELQEEFKVEITSENIEYGKYLANSVTACFHCHSSVDFTKFSGKIVESTLGGGGRYYNEEMGFPGNFYSSNITPYALESWSDSEIYRAIANGVSKDGRALFPLMPYHEYKYMSLDDSKDLIAYLRTIDAFEAGYKISEFTFPFSMVIKMIPSEAEPFTETTGANRGKYLVKIAGCQSCHTPSDGGTPIEEMDFAGGLEIPVETGGICTAANITPDVETGIGSWSKTDFINRFKYYENNDSLLVNHGEFNSEMPWRVYATMTEQDLGAIYDYLRTIKPVRNIITKFKP